ncbi:MAG: type VI secretion system ATPase TssH [Pseudomonadota bacterium]
MKRLLGKLNTYSKRALEAGAGLCVGRTNYEVTVEHLLLVMVEDTGRDFQAILRHFGVEPSHVKRALQRAIEGMKTGNSGRPVFSPALIDWVADGWSVASIELGLAEIRSGALILALLEASDRYAGTTWYDELNDISAEALKRDFFDAVSASEETAGAISVGGGDTTSAPAGDGRDPDGALARFTINFTEQARAGKIDPVFCRDQEIQQMVDILGRRRKNNPIAVGEPGVGKTAVVEGLAVKIAEGDVPDFLKPVDLIGLDLGALQAGAGVKGEFENRLKSVIEEVKGSAKPIVLFIDEAHTLVGAGGQQGGSDAANLLKPALARGELRTIAATTWTEYKKYFEKDPALARRFQLVKLDEPSADQAVTIIRGLRGAYEKSHGVYIRDDAVEAAARLSARYISGRQLPDKAVDVLDTACARVKLSLSTKPSIIDFREKRLAELERAHDSLTRDAANAMAGDDARLADIDEEIATIKGELEELTARWHKERDLVNEILDLRQKLGLTAFEKAPEAEAAIETADAPADDAAAEAGDADAVDTEALKDTLRAKVADLEEIQNRDPIVSYEVTPDAVGQVIADWTGVPLGRMVRDEAASILSLAENLRARVIGQDQAIEAIDAGVRAAKAGVHNPDQPMGVFLFVGPSGVGKTELATAIADQLFGGERFLVTINMSEFQEKHTVSKLVGSPPGYVGYGEGGLLTEAVRQRPYSVVLLDEVEKADLEVMNLFYQVFDKGMLSDGEGRLIDFKNTIVILTSNLATDTLTEMGTKAETPSVEDLVTAIRPTLSAHFKPALLARMQVVPFYPLIGDPLANIVRLKLGKVGKRLASSHRMEFGYSDAVVDAIAARCTEVETGARNIDHIVNRTILPELATELLGLMGEEKTAERLTIDVGDDGRFVYLFDQTPQPMTAAAAGE